MIILRIDQSTINEIKDKTDILDLVSEYVKLEKRGRNYIGLCPFHDEKHPHLQFLKINKFVTASVVKKVVMFFNSHKKLKISHLQKQ